MQLPVCTVTRSSMLVATTTDSVPPRRPHIRHIQSRDFHDTEQRCPCRTCSASALCLALNAFQPYVLIEDRCRPQFMRRTRKREHHTGIKTAVLLPASHPTSAMALSAEVYNASRSDPCVSFGLALFAFAHPFFSLSVLCSLVTLPGVLWEGLRRYHSFHLPCALLTLAACFHRFSSPGRSTFSC